MLIRAFGLFWRADEIEWTPGKGNAGQFRLLGRRGKNNPGLRVADFRDQRGLYVLYGDYGPYYVGLARKRGLGERLKDHLGDHHAGRWDRFSWFGFRRVLQAQEGDGTRRLAKLAEIGVGSVDSAIADMEALLIRALGCQSNAVKMNFQRGEEWSQVYADEVVHYLDKANRLCIR